MESVMRPAGLVVLVKEGKKMNIVKNICSTRVLTAVVSAISAIVCAVLAGCRLCVGELALKDANAEILSVYCITNNSVR